MLALDGHEVRTATTGPEGITAAHEFRPNVVLGDIGLPGMNGYDVAKHLREAPTLTGIHLIAITGYGKQEDRQRSAEAGFDHHLTKPVDPTVLTNLLKMIASPTADRPSEQSAPPTGR